MYLVRALHVRNYSTAKGRFQSNSFSNYNGGISIFDYECAIITTPIGICSHISIFYQRTVGIPIVFQLINFETLQNHFPNSEIVLENTPSDSGDLCHYDLIGIDKKMAENFFKSFCKPPSIYVCQNNQSVQIDDSTHERLAELYELFF